MKARNLFWIQYFLVRTHTIRDHSILLLVQNSSIIQKKTLVAIVLNCKLCSGLNSYSSAMEKLKTRKSLFRDSHKISQVVLYGRKTMQTDRLRAPGNPSEPHLYLFQSPIESNSSIIFNHSRFSLFFVVSQH